MVNQINPRQQQKLNNFLIQKCSSETPILR